MKGKWFELGRDKGKGKYYKIGKELNWEFRYWFGYVIYCCFKLFEKLTGIKLKPGENGMSEETDEHWDNLSICSDCWCATRTIKGKCGKCGATK